MEKFATHVIIFSALLTTEIPENLMDKAVFNHSEVNKVLIIYAFQPELYSITMIITPRRITNRPILLSGYHKVMILHY